MKTETSNNMERFYKINVKDQKPENSGWYDTDKGKLFFFYGEDVFSCREDRISEEYPTWWLKEDNSMNDVEEFLTWLVNTGIYISLKIDAGREKIKSVNYHGKTVSELLEIFQKQK